MTIPRRINDRLLRTLRRNYFWIGYAFFTFYLAYFLNRRNNDVVEHPRIVLLNLFDFRLMIFIIIIISTFILFVALSNTYDRLLRDLMFISQTAIIIFLTIAFLELDTAVGSINIGTASLLFVIFLTISNLMKEPRP